jgi:hypothetical protein
VGRGKRRRLAAGVYSDGSGVALVVWSHGRQIERRLPAGLELAELKRLRAQMRLELEAEAPAAVTRGTFEADVARYLDLSTALAAWKSRRSELRAWSDLYGRRARFSLVRADVLGAMATWRAAGASPKTINNRVIALRALYATLDGPERACPADYVRPLEVPRAPALVVTAATIAEVYARLSTAIADQASTRPRSHHRIDRPRLRHLVTTRARFRLLAVSGVRPSELMRARPEDFDLDRRVWLTRDGKGGRRPAGVPITEAVEAAVREFIEAGAFGKFDTGVFADTVRRFGWPAHLRPYALRRTLGQALTAEGVDLADTAALLGHRRIDTTRQFYVPARDEQLRGALERLDARVAFEGAGVPALPAPDGPARRVVRRRRAWSSGT